jgi:hypothetical protein
MFSSRARVAEACRVQDGGLSGRAPWFSREQVYRMGNPRQLGLGGAAELRRVNSKPLKKAFFLLLLFHLDITDSTTLIRMTR